jgi:hypothetical protein
VFSFLSQLSLIFTAKKPELVKKEPIKGSESVFVHIWETSTNAVGHASIQVGDRQYRSLWPALPGLPGIVPSPAETIKHVQVDMRREALCDETSQNIIDSSSYTPEYQTTNPPSSKKPTRTLEIKGLDTRAMLAELTEQDILIENGRTTYQLFPAFRPLDTLLTSGAALISQDPVDLLVHSLNRERIEGILPRRYNCTMFVRQILNAGGMSTPPKRFPPPWGATPTELGNEITRSGFDVKETRQLA